MLLVVMNPKRFTFSVRVELCCLVPPEHHEVGAVRYVRMRLRNASVYPSPNAARILACTQ